MAMAILGEEGLADDYYSEDTPVITSKMPSKWNIYLDNHMGETQQILIKIKLIASRTPQPNTSTCTPCPAAEIYELRRTIGKNQTIIIFFEWTISEIVEIGSQYEISQIKIGENLLNLEQIYNKDDKIRMIFELWVYHENIKQFAFYLYDLGETRCIWNQIQFKINI